MPATYLSLDPHQRSDDDIQRVAAALADGALVAFPTETVYGIAANAANADAVERLRNLKGRREDQPFTVHIGRRDDLDHFVPSLTPLARRLARKAWPGPLTLVFKVDDPTASPIHPRLSEPGARSIYGSGSVGIRCPDHPVGAALLAATDAPIIASSANVTGDEPPVDAAPIRDSLADRIDFILDAGRTQYEKASTIVSVNGDSYHLLREGVLDERMIRRLATMTVLFVCTGNTCRSPMAEGIFKKMLADRLHIPVTDLAGRGYVVRSAGTMGVSGAAAAPDAVEICRQRGIDISTHLSCGLTPERVHPADFIFTMARHHLDVLRSIAPADMHKVAPIDPDGDVADPIGGTRDDYERAADQITRALQKRIDEVLP